MQAPRRVKKSNAGFTLVELLAAAAIMAFCLAGLLLAYISMFTMTDLSRDMTVATNALQQKFEQVQGTGFSALNNSNFTLASLGFNNTTGMGIVEVSATGYTNATAELKRVRVAISFQSKGRVIGEDKNLNGILDSGEDDPYYNTSSFGGGGKLNSPVEGVIFVTNYN